MFVERLPRMLNQMLGASARKPRILFSDRGPGFYHRSAGSITGEYEGACRAHGFKPWAGANAKEGPRAQPPDIADVLLHETAISWLRAQVAKTTPKRSWEETPNQFAKRLKAGVDHANANYNILGLSKEFPDRLKDLVRVTDGDRLPK